MFEHSTLVNSARYRSFRDHTPIYMETTPRGVRTSDLSTRGLWSAAVLRAADCVTEIGTKTRGAWRQLPPPKFVLCTKSPKLTNTNFNRYHFNGIRVSSVSSCHLPYLSLPPNSLVHPPKMWLDTCLTELENGWSGSILSCMIVYCLAGD